MHVPVHACPTRGINHFAIDLVRALPPGGPMGQVHPGALRALRGEALRPLLQVSVTLSKQSVAHHIMNVWVLMTVAKWSLHARPQRK